jgi:hypothetical protein
MPIMRMDARYAVVQCPQCDAQIARGHRRFGPGQVRCYNCKAVLQTGLPSWAGLSPQQKRRVVLLELLVPSWNRPVSAFIGNLTACILVSIWFATIPCALISAYGYGKAWQAAAIVALLVIAPLVGVLLVPGLRLWRMIRESDHYTETGEPPIWRISPLLQREGK